MADADKNALDLNHLEEELELLLKQNLPTANTPTPPKQQPNLPTTPTPSNASASQSINSTRQTLKDLVKQTNIYAEQSINSTDTKNSDKALAKPSKFKKSSPTVDTLNLNDLYIESTKLNNAVTKHEHLPKEEDFADSHFEKIEVTENTKAKESTEAKIDNTDLSITKGLEDFLNEHKDTAIQEPVEPEVSIIHNAYANQQSSILSPIFNNIKLIALGFISLATAFIYYLYVYQPYAPSIIYADKTPYKTKNMIENLQNQNIVNSADLTNEKNSVEENKTSLTTNNINEKLTIQKPFIKPIVKPLAPVKPVVETNNTSQKPQTIEPPKQKIKIKEETKVSPLPIKSTLPTKIIKSELPKKPFTLKDQEFDSEVEPQVKNIFEPKINSKPITKKNPVVKHKRVINKKLDPWEANQLRKMSHFEYYVQLASSPALNNATHLQNLYNTKYKNILDGKHIMIEKSSLINNRIYYRLRVKSSNLAKARSICLKIKNMGGQCIFGKN